MDAQACIEAAAVFNTDIVEPIDYIEAEVLLATQQGVVVEQLIEAHVEVTEWSMVSDAIYVKDISGEEPEWFKDLINDAIDWSLAPIDPDELQDVLEQLGAGYTNLISITDEQTAQLTYLAAENEYMAASIQELQLTRVTEDQAYAISQETIGAWMKGGESAAWFDQMVYNVATNTAANSAALTSVNAELDDIAASVIELSEATVTKTQNPDWVDSCDYTANENCIPDDPDAGGNDRWIYTAKASHKLLVDANGNIAGLDITADNNESAFKIFADKFYVVAHQNGVAQTAPFLVNTTTTPASIVFNGQVHFYDPTTGESGQYFDDIRALEEQAAQALALGALAQETANTISEDGVIAILEKEELITFSSQITAEKDRAILRYAEFTIDPNGAIPAPPLDVHWANLTAYIAAHDDLKDYLTNVIEIDNGQDYIFPLVDPGDPASDPDTIDFDTKFTTFFGSRADAIDGLLELSVDAMAVPGAGTIIDGGNLTTGKIQSNTEVQGENFAVWDLQNGHFRTHAGIDLGYGHGEFILDSTAVGEYFGPNDPQNTPNVAGGLIEGATIAGSTIHASTDITSPSLLVGHIKVQGKDYDGVSNLYTGVPSATLLGTDSIGTFYGWNNPSTNEHSLFRICNSGSQLVIMAKYATDVAARDGDAAQMTMYLEMSTDGGTAWTTIQTAYRREDPDLNSATNSQLPVSLNTVINTVSFTGLETVSFRLTWTGDSECDASDPEIMVTVYNS